MTDSEIPVKFSIRKKSEFTREPKMQIGSFRDVKKRVMLKIRYTGDPG